MKRQLARTGAVACAGAVLATGLASGAAAAPLQHVHEHEVGSVTFEDCGVQVENAYDVRVHILSNQRGADRLAYWKGNFHGTNVLTNLQTGKTMTHVFNYVDKDHATVDNGDGTLTITVMATGGDRWYDAAGKLLFRNPGQIRYQLLIDHNGTPSDPSDDELVADLGVIKGSTGRNDTEGRDFCEDFIAVTS